MTTTTPQTTAEPTTTAPDGPETTTTTTVEGSETTATTTDDSSGVATDVLDVVGGAGPNLAGDVAGDVATAPFDALNHAGQELAGTAFGDLAEITSGLGDANSIVLGNLTLTFHMIAGFIAFTAIATTLLFIIVLPRRKLGTRLTHLGTSTAKYLVISALGVTIGVAMVELSGRLTNSAILYTLPDTINTENANLYDAALAVVVVPLVGVAFEFQRFFVGILIAFWPVAAAVSIYRGFRNALPIFTALLVANCLWPPLAALAIGKAFAALPSVGGASWWCLAAVATAPIANAIALNARAD